MRGVKPLLWQALDDHHLRRVEQTWDFRNGVGRSSGNDHSPESALENASRISRQDPLAGGIQAPSEQADLSAVGVTRQDQVDPFFTQHGLPQAPVFGMVGQEYLIAFLSREAV